MQLLRVSRIMRVPVFIVGQFVCPYLIVWARVTVESTAVLTTKSKNIEKGCAKEAMDRTSMQRTRKIHSSLVGPQFIAGLNHIPLSVPLQDIEGKGRPAKIHET